MTWRTYRKITEKEIVNYPPLPTEIWVYIIAKLTMSELIALFFAHIKFVTVVFCDEDIQSYRYTYISEMVSLYIQDFMTNLTLEPLPFELFFGGTLNSSVVRCPRIDFLLGLTATETDWTRIKTIRRDRELDNITLLSTFCTNLTCLRLPQSQWHDVVLLNHAVVKMFFVKNPNLCVVDLSGYNIHSEILLGIFRQSPIYGMNLEYLKFSGEQSNSLTDTIGNHLINSGIDYMELDNDISDADLNYSYHFANFANTLRSSPITVVRTLPEPPNRVFCTNNVLHNYCKRCFKDSVIHVSRRVSSSRRICSCVLRRLNENYRRYGNNYAHYCECILTYLRYSIRCLEFSELVLNPLE